MGWDRRLKTFLLLSGGLMAFISPAINPLRASTLTMGGTSTSPYQFTVAGAPVSAVTINAGDSVAWDSSLNATGSIMLGNPPGNCYQSFGSFPATQTFTIPGIYGVHNPSYSTCTSCAACTGFAATIVVNPPVTVTSPPCNWAVTAVTYLASGSYSLCLLHVFSGGTLYLLGAVTLTVSGDVMVDSGGVMSGTGLGFSGCGWGGSMGPGAGSSSWGSGGGGGHAGMGGNGLLEVNDSLTVPVNGGSSYDNAAAPSQSGSGGGCGICNYSGCGGPSGGNGGAAIVLSALSGTVYMNGLLDFSGMDGGPAYYPADMYDYTHGGGGGAGGTVYISAQNITGSGLINVHGGNGGNGCCDDDFDNFQGGGGSGGIITLCIINSNTYSGSVGVQGGSGIRIGGGGIFTNSALCNPSVTPTPFTFTPTYTPTPCPPSYCTPTATSTPTPTLTNTPPYTPTPTPTFPTFTFTYTPIITNTPIYTPTPTYTPTFTYTFTPTHTPTFSLTPTTTITPTNTSVCQPRVFPNPYNPQTAVRGTLKLDCLSPGATVAFYTVSGELVIQMVATNPQLEWDGRNRDGARVSSGIYYYLVQQGDKVIVEGKVLVVNSS